MADAYQHRADISKLDQDLKFVQKSLAGPYAFLPEESKLDLKQHLEDLQAQCAEKRKLRDAALATLGQTNFWPIFARTETEEAQKKKYEDMVNTVADLHGTVASIHSVLHAAVEQHNSNLITDIVDDEIAGRPRKRRRLGEAGEAAPLEDELSPSELSTVMDQVQQVESRLSDLQNLLHQRDNDISEAIQDAIDERYEMSGPPQDAEGDSATAAAVAQLKQIVESTGNDMGEVAVELGAVITQVEVRSQETAQLKEKYARTLAEIAQVSS